MVRMDPATGAITASFVPSQPERWYADAEAGFGAVWAISNSNEVGRINPDSDKITLSVTVGSDPTDYNDTIAVGQRYVWVAISDDRSLVGLDPNSGDEVARLDMDGPGVVAAGEAGVWVALENGTLFQVDERKKSIGRSIDAGTQGYNLVEVGTDYVWFVGSDAELRQFAAATGELVASFPLAGGPEGFLIADGSAWIEYYARGRVERLDLGISTE